VLGAGSFWGASWICIKISSIVNIYIIHLINGICRRVDSTESDNNEPRVLTEVVISTYLPTVSCLYSSQARSQLEEIGEIGATMTVYPLSARSSGILITPPK